MNFNVARSFASVGRFAVKLSTVALVAAGMAGPAKAQNTQQYWNVFFRAGYGYCDARKLAKIWRTTPGQAKAKAGWLIRNGNSRTVRHDWTRGVAFFRRYRFSCGSSSLPDDQRRYTYNDADNIAKAWTRRGDAGRG